MVTLTKSPPAMYKAKNCTMKMSLGCSLRIQQLRDRLAHESIVSFLVPY